MRLIERIHDFVVRFFGSTRRDTTASCSISIKSSIISINIGIEYKTSNNAVLKI